MFCDAKHSKFVRNLCSCQQDSGIEIGVKVQFERIKTHLFHALNLRGCPMDSKMEITMNKTVFPSPVRGTVNAPVSKSDLHRALICAALCKGTTALPVLASNSDTDATAECLSALGARVDRTEDGFVISGPMNGGGELNCRESGSTLRFLLPVAAVLGKESRFSGSGKLPSRPVLPLTSELRKKGSVIDSDFLPITVKGKARGGVYTLPGNVSSQFISGLLLALPYTGEYSEVRLSSPLESKMYVDMTVNTLSRFGVEWKEVPCESEDFPYGGYSLVGGEYITSGTYVAEGDWSGAAFPLVAGAIGGSVTVNGLAGNSAQPDREIERIVREFGADVSWENGSLNVKTAEKRPFSVDVSQFPDLFPVLSVLAAAANGESRLYNAGRLRIKESDRISAVCNMINALGGKATADQDSLTVYGNGKLVGGTVNGENDHRIVMSAAIASLICEKEVTILGSEAVGKSYPAFFEDFAEIH